ncbi:MAG: type II toxin-antitoxin system Phd/YefM family antitoxin [Leptospiraceae bacterium]|nr:type II toxin-antitoxin system Phd/YefM family antitoxin [Leptospiraceae bacterium]
MERISISNLKTHLSATLKEVVKGIRYVVMDRDNPVAVLVPYPEKSRLVVRAPIGKPKKVKNTFKGKLRLDPVEYLLQDRRGSRF